MWPEERELRKVIQGTGGEVIIWIKKQIDRAVNIKIIKEGTIPVDRRIHLDEEYDNVEFKITPLEPPPAPVEMPSDGRGGRVCSIRHVWGVSQEEVQKQPQLGTTQ
jgi:hypothetical protein